MVLGAPGTTAAMDSIAVSRLSYGFVAGGKMPTFSSSSLIRAFNPSVFTFESPLAFVMEFIVTVPGSLLFFRI